MNRGAAAPGAQRGAVTVAVIVLVALLALIGTAMALAVSANLDAVRELAGQAARQYAAESAVAYGQALARPGGANCVPGGGSVNGQTYSFVCEPALTNVSASADAIAEWAFPARVLQSDVAAAVPYGPSAISQVTAWAVVAWRPVTANAQLRVCFETIGSGNVDANCDAGREQTYATPGAAYFTARMLVDADDHPNFHLTGIGGSVATGPLVLRETGTGTDSVVTVVGQAGPRIAEGDLWVSSGGGVTVGVRDTVWP